MQIGLGRGRPSGWDDGGAPLASDRGSDSLCSPLFIHPEVPGKLPWRADLERMPACGHDGRCGQARQRMKAPGVSFSSGQRAESRLS